MGVFPRKNFPGNPHHVHFILHRVLCVFRCEISVANQVKYESKITNFRGFASGLNFKSTIRYSVITNYDSE